MCCLALFSALCFKYLFALKIKILNKLGNRNNQARSNTINRLEKNATLADNHDQTIDTEEQPVAFTEEELQMLSEVAKEETICLERV
jgi:hypothetical protein